MRSTGPLIGALAIGVALLMCACTSSPEACRETESASPEPSASSDSRFVTADGRAFEADGEPFRFVGVNVYDAAATDVYSCREGSRMSDRQLVETFRTLREESGTTVVRFWAYQTYTQGATYWAGVDRVLRAARETGIRVMPVLDDGPGDCTTSSTPKIEYEGDTWYTEGYRTRDGDVGLSYRDYVARITEHYADDPTILGWTMINEAETNARTETGESVLVDFARDIASVIRSSDPNHLITLGTQSNSAPGASGPDFTAVYGLPQLSFAEVHDWGARGSDSSPMPGSATATPPPADSLACALENALIGCSFALAADLDKPLVVGEAGMVGTTERERELRASRLRAKMDAAFDAGASGYLVWGVTGAKTDGYDVSITDDDPLIGEMKRVAGAVGRTGPTMSPPSPCQE